MILLLFASACEEADPETTPRPRNTFDSRFTSEEGSVVAWQGYTEGYQPGAVSPVTILLENESQQDWPGRYCIQLLDQDGVVAILESLDFTLEPDLGSQRELDLPIPDNLAPGPYALALVVRRPSGPLVDVIHIRVGQDGDAGVSISPAVVDQARERCLAGVTPGTGESQGTAQPPGTEPQGTPVPVAEGQGEILYPGAGAQIAPPLHLLAYAGQPDQEVKAILRWQDGTEVEKTFTTLAAPDGRGLLAGSLDWTAYKNVLPDSQPATLTLRGASQAVLAQRGFTPLNPFEPELREIELYWILNQDVQPVSRRILETASVEAAALEALLWGPSPALDADYRTALPTPQEVLTYPGRQPDWGVRVELLGLTIEDGLATANFSQEMRAYGGGSARVQNMHEQIVRTLEQFPTVQRVAIAVEGRVDEALQP
jgi:hypothetical protein